MKINLYNAIDGLKPLYDDDYDNKRKLKIGHVYVADIKQLRNVKFHRKYFSLVNTAWEYLTERQTAFFSGNKDTFRKTIEIAAGYYEPVYSIARREWIQQARSIAFDKMSEDEFSELYERVKDVLFATFLKNVSQEEFLKNLINY